MYIPTYYQASEAQIRDFIDQNPFGILCSTSADYHLRATHLPFEVVWQDDELFLRGHLAKANPQWKDFDQKQVLVVLQGNHAYISPSWYMQPNVPTWNYLAVHLYGTIQIFEGQKLYEMLEKMVNKYEKNRPNAVTMDKIPKKMLEEDLAGIVGFEIEVAQVEASFKLSQNRDAVSYQNIVQELEKTGEALAQDMKKK